MGCRAAQPQCVELLKVYIKYFCRKNVILTCDQSALGEGISLVSPVADTYWNVVPDTTGCIDATEARTGIHTSLASTGLVSWTVNVYNALRAAVWRRTSHIWLTGAVTAVSISSWRISIWTTGVGVAGVFFYNCFYS